MAASRAAQERAPRHRLPPAEKRRIVELTLRDDTSIRAIAREHGVSRNTLRRWQELYRAGKLAAQPAPSGGAGVPGATFLPVTIAPAVRAPRVAAIPKGLAGNGGLVELTLSSGDSLRIETAALDAGFVCALLAELRR